MSCFDDMLSFARCTLPDFKYVNMVMIAFTEDRKGEASACVYFS